MSRDTEEAAKTVEDHPVTEFLARAGFAAYGLVFLILAWLAFSIAYGGGGGEATKTGALKQLSETSYGFALIIVVAVSLGVLSLWQLLSAFLEARLQEDTKDATKQAVRHVARGVMYGLLAYTAAQVLMGKGGSSEKSRDSLTATLMDMPFGVILVSLFGLGFFGYGCYSIYKGATKRFKKELQEEPPNAIEKMGMVGYVAKGLTYLVMGGLIILAAVRHNPEKSAGLDQALHTLMQQPFGNYILTFVAIGFIAFGLYSMARAKYADV